MHTFSKNVLGVEIKRILSTVFAKIIHRHVLFFPLKGVWSMKTDKNRQQNQSFMDRLPKNLRQIGKIDKSIKIYAEDYAMTYLKRLLSDETEKKAVILLGDKVIKNEITYLFIKAVMEPPESVWEGQSYLFSEDDKEKIAEDIEQYFSKQGEKLQILGWAVNMQEEGRELSEEIQRGHRQAFKENYSLVLKVNVSDGEETFFVNQNGKFQIIEGYYVYFEKNNAMVRYVSLTQKSPCVESEEVIKGKSESYRMVLQKRKEEVSHKQAVSFLYVASTFLVMVVVVLGITMMNNYEKMQNMQEVLESLSKSVINGEVTGKNVNQKEPVYVTTAADSPAQEEAEELTQKAVVTAQTNTASASSVQTVQNTSQGSQPEVKRASASVDSYEIQTGDTLVSISRKFYQTITMVEEICNYNNIDDSNCITAGDIIRLP